jgi:hypothetical protein
MYARSTPTTTASEYSSIYLGIFDALLPQFAFLYDYPLQWTNKNKRVNQINMIDEHLHPIDEKVPDGYYMTLSGDILPIPTM